MMPHRQTRTPDSTAPSRRHRRRTAAVLLAVVAAAMATSSYFFPTPSDPASIPLSAEGALVRFAVAGDSITADESPRVPAQVVGPRSWVRFANDGAAGFVGGWAVGGATTADMAANLQPVSADALVVLAGTNDIHRGVPYEQIGANLQAIVAKAQVRRVVVCSVPPRDDFQQETIAYNQWLQVFAGAQGWDWTDASAGLRDPAAPGRYAPGLAYDPVHPSEAGARVLGAAILAELSEGAELPRPGNS